MLPVMPGRKAKNQREFARSLIDPRGNWEDGRIGYLLQKGEKRVSEQKRRGILALLAKLTNLTFFPANQRKNRKE